MSDRDGYDDYDDERRSDKRYSRKNEKRGRANYIEKYLVILLMIFCAVGGFLVKSWIVKQHEPKITSTSLGEKLQAVSDLTSAKVDYSGILTITEGDIPFITEKGFTMRYSAEIRAGIDVSEVEIEVKDDEVNVTVPEADIQSVYVDPSSIIFYDRKMSLFNWNTNEDAIDAVKEAENDALAMINKIALKEEADKQIEEIYTAILKEAIGDRELNYTRSKKLNTTGD
ncbi:MAG: DUF4230 domain-containing protein [Lachnospiraceae bacterium]|nr:DUF4230 domain-containing protein [Lachnospiraceae bacterium]